MKYPDIWGGGAIFCFSAFDGRAVPGEDMVGALSSDRLGINFENGRIALNFTFGKSADLHYEAVASDFISGAADGNPFSIIFTSQNIITGTFPKNIMKPYLFSDPSVKRCSENAAFLLGRWYALAENGGRFAFAGSISSMEDAVGLSALALQKTPDENGKKAFFDKLDAPAGLADYEEKTLAKCISVMKSQICSPYGRIGCTWTTPDRFPHRHMWLWDSVFHSVGNIHISPELAKTSIKAVLSVERDDGFIPHMTSGDRISGITQPPVLAWGVMKYLKSTGDARFITECYDTLKRFIGWIIKNRDINGNSLFEWDVNVNSVTCRCDESGMDNSPRFDGVARMDCVDFSSYMANEARCMADFACRLGKEDDRINFEELYLNIKNAVNEKLWSDDDGIYFDRETESGKLRKVFAVSSFLPLFAGICTPERAEILIRQLTDPQRFMTACPIPSVAVSDKTFGDDMWRGPMWINMNYMIIEGLKEYGYTGLAGEITDKTIRCVSDWYENDGVLYEFYDSCARHSPSRMPRKGPAVVPYNPEIRIQAIHDYGWTASLTAAMIYEKYQN